MDVDQIETVAGQFAKRVYKLGKEIKGWKVLESLKERVDNMKKLMPLIGDLRNPAMRERHWKQLMEEVGKTFDPHSEDFTLETVIALGLEHYQETITTLSTAAGKELAIEEALQRIEEQRQARQAAHAESGLPTSRVVCEAPPLPTAELLAAGLDLDEPMAVCVEVTLNGNASQATRNCVNFTYYDT